MANLHQHQARLQDMLAEAKRQLIKAKEKHVEKEQVIAQLRRQLHEREREMQRAPQERVMRHRDEPTYEGQISGHTVQIFGFIKAEPRVCNNCRRMIDRNQAVRCARLYLPCRWSNQRRDGHIYEFPAALAIAYQGLASQ